MVAALEDANENTSFNDNRFTMRLEITFNVNGVTYNAAHLAYIENSEFKKIVNAAKGV